MELAPSGTGRWSYRDDQPCLSLRTCHLFGCGSDWNCATPPQERRAGSQIDDGTYVGPDRVDHLFSSVGPTRPEASKQINLHGIVNGGRAEVGDMRTLSELREVARRAVGVADPPTAGSPRPPRRTVSALRPA